jgi:hypothetical protein
MMTVRVDTLDVPFRSLSWLVPRLRTLPFTATARLSRWWEDRSSALVMSDQWMHEFRSTERRS